MDTDPAHEKEIGSRSNCQEKPDPDPNPRKNPDLDPTNTPGPGPATLAVVHYLGKVDDRHGGDIVDRPARQPVVEHHLIALFLDLMKKIIFNTIWQIFTSHFLLLMLLLEYMLLCQGDWILGKGFAQALMHTKFCRNYIQFSFSYSLAEFKTMGIFLPSSWQTSLWFSEKSSVQVFTFLIRNVIEGRVGKIPHLSLVASHGEFYFSPLVALPLKGKNPILSSYPSFNSSIPILRSWINFWFTLTGPQSCHHF